jgi:hypothetical protein
MNSLSAQERRRLKRKSLAYYMLVLDAHTQEKIGHLIDITPLGLMMDCQKQLPLEQDFRLRLDTTPDVADKNHVTFTARSKWCLPDALEPYLYDIGFSITKIEPHDAEIVNHIMEKYAARDNFSFPIRNN